MKKICVVLTGILFISVMAIAQKSEREVASNAPASSVARFSWINSETMDIGKIEKGKPVTLTFEFKNTGNAPLLISSAKGQCGCTSVEYSKQAIAPNEKGFVKATYNAASEGVFNKSITVIANTIDQQVQLTFKGEVN